MDNEYLDDLYVLVDEEDGSEHTFEMLDTIELDSCRYLALAPYEPDADEDDDREIYLFKLVDNEDGDDGDPLLVSIDDDDEHDRIGGIFLERLKEMLEDAEDDED